MKKRFNYHHFEMRSSRKLIVFVLMTQTKPDDIYFYYFLLRKTDKLTAIAANCMYCIQYTQYILCGTHINDRTNIQQT